MPDILVSVKARRARDAAAQHFRASDARARQSLYRFAPLHNDRSVKDALSTLFSSKCAFCESEVSAVAPLDVHHFRPRQQAVDPRNGEVSRRHYWWLAYEWENLYPACVDCNRHAGARFPVNGKRVGVPQGTGFMLSATYSLIPAMTSLTDPWPSCWMALSPVLTSVGT